MFYFYIYSFLYNDVFTNIFIATYGGAATLPKVLEGKCDQSTCTTLESDLDVVESCMTDFNANTCTFKSTSTSLPAKMSEVIHLQCCNWMRVSHPFQLSHDP